MVSRPRRFIATVMLVVCAATALALWFAPRELEQQERERAALEYRVAVEAQRKDAQRQTGLLKELCRSILRKPRVQAALEEDSIPDLYANVRSELEQRTVIDGTKINGRDAANGFRFLDKTGMLISPPGTVREAWESQISQGHIPDTQDTVDVPGPNGSVLELLTTPILDSDTDETLYVMVLCLPRPSSWLSGTLVSPGFTATDSIARTSALRWKIIGIGGVSLAAAFGAFYVITATKNQI